MEKPFTPLEHLEEVGLEGPASSERSGSAYTRGACQRAHLGWVGSGCRELEKLRDRRNPIGTPGFSLRWQELMFLALMSRRLKRMSSRNPIETNVMAMGTFRMLQCMTLCCLHWAPWLTQSSEPKSVPVSGPSTLLPPLRLLCLDLYTRSISVKDSPKLLAPRTRGWPPGRNKIADPFASSHIPSIPLSTHTRDPQYEHLYGSNFLASEHSASNKRSSHERAASECSSWKRSRLGSLHHDRH